MLAVDDVSLSRARAVDPSGNLSGYSSVVDATTDAAPSAPPGPVGAWAFNEGVGTTTADASGNGNIGTINGRDVDDRRPLRQRAGLQRRQQHGQGRSSASLNLTNGDDAVGVDQADGVAERLAHDDAAPAGRILPERQQQRRAAASRRAAAPSAATRTSRRPDREPGERVDARGDDLRRRRPCGSTSTARRSRREPRPAPIQTGTNPLWIGGNSPYGEYFQGLIDEVRVYNRALSQTELRPT